MAGSLAASFFSTNKNSNLAVPGDTVTFTFSDPPPDATDVLVSVLETVTFLDTTKPVVTDRPIGGFRGSITGKTFKVDKILGAPPPSEPDPVVIRIAANPAPGSPSLFADMPAPEQVLSHSLRLRVEGQIAGVGSRFDGTHLLQVEYPLGMIVPTVPASNDPSLAVVESWGQQWLAHKPRFRDLEHVNTLRFTRAIQSSDYNDLIAKFVTCAKKATSGVVALAVGHGDGGQGNPNSIAWCNIVPENFAPPPPAPKFSYNLDIDENVLRDGAGPPNFPQGSSKVKLDALDRLSDALKGTGIRRIILHTCNAGNSKAFMQMFADRLQVPLFAHTSSIQYTGAAGSKQILASYVGVTPVSPRDLRHWPVSRMAGPFRPGKAPKRFGP